MRSSSALTVFGSINQDLTLEVNHFPAPGETIIATRVSRAIGGKGANQALAAALHGTPTEMIAAVGDDAAGHYARSVLIEAGVRADNVTTLPETPTGTAYITVQTGGENHIVVDPGANHELTAPVETSHDFEPSAWCLLSLEVPEAEAHRFATLAAKRGSRIALNASPQLHSGLDAGLVDLLLVNEVEMATIAGHGWHLHRNLADELGVGAVVVTQGGDGVRVDVRRRRSSHVDAMDVSLRDTTGCGDAFAGVLMSEVCRGAEYLRAAEVATVYAGFVAELAGASASYGHAFARAQQYLSTGASPESP